MARHVFKPALVLTVCSLLLLAPATAAARRPVISYIDGHGVLRLYDSARHRDIRPPAVPTFHPISRFRYGMSLNGRYVVFNDSAGRLHLLDRRTKRRVPLPGVNVSANPGSLTVSNTGLIAFDDNGQGPARVYDSVKGQFVDTGLPADNGHRQTRLSGNGRFLATSCSDRCVRDTGGSAVVFVQDLRTKTDRGFPANTPRDEEHPCLNQDGSLLAFDAPSGFPNDQNDDIWVSPDNLGATNGVEAGTEMNTRNADDQFCAFDPSGEFLSFVTGSTTFKLFDRGDEKAVDPFVPLPANRDFNRFSVLTDRFPRGDRTPPRVRRFRITHHRFVVGPHATAFKFNLSEPARVRIRIGRHGSFIGTVRRRGHRGANTIPFDGRLGRASLSPGRYSAIIRATDRAVNRSFEYVLEFRVLPRN